MNLALAQRSTRLQPSLIPLQDMVDEAVEFLRQHEPPEGYFVGFSGGKDSIVTLELCRMAGVKHEAYHSLTGIDAPELVKFIRQEYPDIPRLKAPIRFFDLVEAWFPPTRMSRWCCDALKKNSSRPIPLKRRVMGIRAEESSNRASRPRIDKFKWKQVFYKPIFQWSEWQIWKFIEDSDLAYPSLYEEGFERIGCMFCPQVCYSNSAQLAMRKARWPWFFKAFERHCLNWWNNRSPETVARYPEKTFGEWLEAYYRGFE